MARANGMRSLDQDGMLKANLGLTSLEEVVRVLSFRGNVPSAVRSERKERSGCS